MTKYQVFLIIVFLFFFGSGGGWVLELFFRRFFSGANPERKWLNPGFLFGPCVPLYGFGTVVLFILSEFESQIFGQFGGSWWYYLVMFFGMALAMTALEYIAGLMSLKAVSYTHLGALRPAPLGLFLGRYDCRRAARTAAGGHAGGI